VNSTRCLVLGTTIPIHPAARLAGCWSGAKGYRPDGRGIPAAPADLILNTAASRATVDTIGTSGA
jgi:hypothetical protein